MFIVAEDCNKELSVRTLARLKTLTPEHLEYLTKIRGLDKEWVKANCFSITAEEASQILGYKVYSDGILILGENGYFQFKPDKPYKNLKKEKTAKYQTPRGVDYDAWLPKHPTIENFWEDVEAIKKMSIEIDGHPCIELTEGNIKAITGCQNDIATISVVGVWMGAKKTKNKVYKKLVKSLERLADLGFGFIFAFDADCFRKPQVMKAQRELGQLLLLKGVPVLTCTGHWKEEDGKGMDDLIQNKGIDEYRKILMNAQDFREWQAEHFDPDDPGAIKPLSHQQIAEKIASEYKKKWKWCSDLQSWLKYDEEAQTWDLKKNDVFSMFINQYLIDNEQPNNIKYKNEIIRYLRDTWGVEHWKEDDESYIPFNNVVYEHATKKVHENSPDFNFTWCLPHNYEVNGSTEFPIIDEWLDWLTQGSKYHKEVLIAYAAATLKGYIKLHKFLYLIGKGGSGKTTYTDLLTKLVGKRNTGALNIDQLDNENMMFSAMNKRLVVFGDQDPVGKKIKNFKRLTGGELISARQLYKDTITFQFKGRCVVTSNFPFIFASATSRALDRRLILIECNNKLDEENQEDMMEKFDPEMSAFSKYLLSLDDKYIKNLLNNFGKGKEKSAESLSYQMEADAMLSWINDWVIFDNKESTRIGSKKDEWFAKEYLPEISTLYGSFCKYAGDTKREIKNLQTFSRELIEKAEVLGYDLKKVKKRWNGQNPTNVLIGIRLRTEKDYDIPTLEEQRRQEANLQSPEEENEVYTYNPDTEGITDNVDSVDPLRGSSRQSFEEKISDEEVKDSITDKEPPRVDISQQSDEEKGNDIKEDLPSFEEKKETRSPLVEENIVDINSINYNDFPCSQELNDEERIKRITEISKLVLYATEPLHFDVVRKLGIYSNDEINWVWANVCSDEDKARIHQLLSNKDNLPKEEENKPSLEEEPQKTIIEQENKPSPEEKPPQATIKKKKSVEVDYSTFPHLTCDGIRAKENKAQEIKRRLIEATTAYQLDMIKAFYGKDQILWVEDNILSLTEKDYIEEIYHPSQMNIDWTKDEEQLE